MGKNKIGLVMEGGSMRGMFTAGVTDVMMENGIEFDGAIGVSAGAAFGCNYKSRQPGRAIRYNKKYCKDKRFAGIGNFIKSGNIFGTKFCYKTIPDELDVFDREAFKNNPMEFYIVATDVEKGCEVYYRLDNGDDEDVDLIRASASMPLVSKIVEVDGTKLLDGGIADSIPLRGFEKLGYNKNVVILTQPKGFVKEKNKHMKLIKFKYRKYPNFVGAVADRHIKYNAETLYVSRQEEAGNAFVIQPPEALNISGIIRDPEELERVYQIGRKVMKEKLEKLNHFLKKARD
ncbi:MAG: patatin family protein [Lachnospiraceae bacterium]|nr:patatin family protein [Lachnospiraceae bacterium]